MEQILEFLQYTSTKENKQKQRIFQRLDNKTRRIFQQRQWNKTKQQSGINKKMGFSKGILRKWKQKNIYMQLYPINPFLVQKYIDKPFLYKKRKFDIRCFILITTLNGVIKAYWYQDGYIRTSSVEYNLKRLDNKKIHLTNDAIQKKGDNYGKYENGNKISYAEYQKFLDENFPGLNFQRQVYPQLKQMAGDAVKSVYLKIDPLKKMYSYELFGLDFMIDSKFNPWLIEINTNPCLEQSSPLLGKIFPPLIENMFQIAIDPLFPPPLIWTRSKQHMITDNPYKTNRFELIFDELHDGTSLKNILGKMQNYMLEEEEEEMSDND